MPINDGIQHQIIVYLVLVYEQWSIKYTIIQP